MSKKYYVSTSTLLFEVGSIADGVRRLISLERYYGHPIEASIIRESEDKLGMPAGVACKGAKEVARLIRRENARQMVRRDEVMSTTGGAK
jgi:hypothetical protein